MNIDLQRVLLNLRRARVPVSKVARTIGMDDQTLRNVARGEVASMRWHQVVLLLDLHYDTCPEQHSRAQLMKG